MLLPNGTSSFARIHQFLLLPRNEKKKLIALICIFVKSFIAKVVCNQMRWPFSANEDRCDEICCYQSVFVRLHRSGNHHQYSTIMFDMCSSPFTAVDKCVSVCVIWRQYVHPYRFRTVCCCVWHTHASQTHVLICSLNLGMRCMCRAHVRKTRQAIACNKIKFNIIDRLKAINACMIVINALEPFDATVLRLPQHITAYLIWNSFTFATPNTSDWLLAFGPCLADSNSINAR